MQNNIINICNENLEVAISTLGAEIQSLKFKGKEYIYDGSDKIWKGKAPVLFPFAGSLKDGKFIFENKEYNITSHGFARRKEFSVVNSSQNEVKFLLSDTEETLEVYPFKFNLFITYTLENNVLKVKKEVVNTDTKAMYFGAGSHEGIVCNRDKSNLSLSFNKKENLDCLLLDKALINGEKSTLAKDTKVLNLKNEYFNEANTLIFENVNSNEVTLLEDGIKILKLTFDARNLLIWSDVNAPFICLEPWTNLPDLTYGDNQLTNKLGIIKLEKGQTKVINHSIELF